MFMIIVVWQKNLIILIYPLVRKLLLLALRKHCA